MLTPRYQAEHQYRLSPTDQRTVRTFEPMARAVRTHLHQLPTDGLDNMAAVGAICPQLLDQLYDKKDTV
jgi:hypothetical protein